MRLQFSILVISFITLSTISCKSKTETSSTTCNLETFLNDYVDSTVKPQDDFFLFTMGKWIKNNPIPGAERSWGIWSKVNEENYLRLKSINEEAAAKKSETGSNWQKIGDLWYTGMDTVSIEKQSVQPLKQEFDKINAIADINGLVAEIGRLQSIGASPFFGEYIAQDEKNSEKMAVHLGQGGIGLPDRDFYFDTDSRSRKIRNEYVKHLEKMFALLGDNENTAKINAATVMRLETSMAEKSRKLAALRDPYKNYNKMGLPGLDKLAPSVDWKNLFAANGITSVDTIIVGQPEFFVRMEELIKKNSLADWKTYLRWNLINSFAAYLSTSFDKENFYFYGTVLNGTKEQRARWKRVLDTEGRLMGFMLGQLYIERYYSQAIKARILINGGTIHH